MLLVIAVSMTDEEIQSIAAERWYSHTKRVVQENDDWTRENVEKKNNETPQVYLEKMYTDLVVSDIVNTKIWYKNRVGEEVDAKAEKETRTEVKENVSVNVI